MNQIRGCRTEEARTAGRSEAGAANEWWFVVGHLQSHGHLFGYEVQLIVRTNALGGSVPKPPARGVLANDSKGPTPHTREAVW